MNLTNHPLHMLSGLLSGFSPTYIVDSDEAFVDWIRGTAGNDYTYVLVKKGTFVADYASINLSQTGTLGVVGEPGSILHFTNGGPTNCFNGSGDPREFFVNVTVKAQEESSFNGCRNLFNCRGYGSVWYDGCENVVNCVSEGGYYKCNNLVNCTSERYGFDGCNRLINCTAQDSFFIGCTNLVGCVVEGTVSGSSYNGCRVMFGNRDKAGGGYNLCYMNSSGTSNPIWNTLEGGYNV